MKTVDVAETLVDEADALGDDLAFDAEGNPIAPRKKADRRAEPKHHADDGTEPPA